MKLQLLTLLFSALSTIGIGQTTVAGKANVMDGLVIFVESVPAIQYRHLGTVECSMFAPDRFQDLMAHMIKQARKAYPDAEFNALIFRPNKGMCKADVIQFYPDPSEKRRRSRRGEEEQVNETYLQSVISASDGVYLFVENNPEAEFTLLGKIEIPATFKSTNPDDYLKEMKRIAKETYPDYNGLVFISGTNLTKANVIKLIF
ncbi:MAG: hypothetical protein Kow0075_14750 [Salibacteraceae bacterium]